MQQQIQGQTEPPVQALQLAEARHMGEFLAAHPRNHKVYPVGITLGIVAFIALSTFYIPFLGLPWSIYLLLLAFTGIGIYALQKRSGKVHCHDQLLLYSAGFIYLVGKQSKVYRWEDIKYIIRGAILPEGRGMGDIDVLSIAFVSQGHFRFPHSWEKHSRAAICDTIERCFVEARLPQVLEQYNAGAEIEFSQQKNGLSVSLAGFHENNNLLPWSMVEKAEVNSERVIIRKEGRTSDWYHALFCTVPNAALLKALLSYRQYSL